MEFKKVGNRFVLPPRERIIKVLKHYHEASISQLIDEVSIQADALNKILDKLTEEGLVTVISTKIEGENNREVVANKRVIWKGDTKDGGRIQNKTRG